MMQTNQSTVHSAVEFAGKIPPTWALLSTNTSYEASRALNFAGMGITGRRSTFGALLLMNVLLAAPMQIPTNPIPLNEQVREQTRLGVAVSRYSYEKTAYSRIVAYLNAHPDADKLLYDLPDIIDKIYGENIEKKLEIVADHDTGEDIMIVLFDSGIEGYDLLDDKETELFQKIEESGLGAGLFHVVLSQI